MVMCDREPPPHFVCVVLGLQWVIQGRIGGMLAMFHLLKPGHIIVCATVVAVFRSQRCQWHVRESGHLLNLVLTSVFLSLQSTYLRGRFESDKD